jgi:predicted small integral membrane protein
LKDWFRGYDEAPARIRFLRVVFAFSALAFIISFFGPAILSGEIMGFWMYQDWALTYAGLTYIVIIIATFMIAIVSGIPTLRYEWKRMRQSGERREN